MSRAAHLCRIEIRKALLQMVQRLVPKLVDVLQHWGFNIAVQSHQVHEEIPVELQRIVDRGLLWWKPLRELGELA